MKYADGSRLIIRKDGSVVLVEPDDDDVAKATRLDFQYGIEPSSNEPTRPTKHELEVKRD